MSIILKGGLIVTMDSGRRGLKNHGIVIEQNRIKAIVPVEQLPQPDLNTQVIDCKGKVIFPGFINLHTHQTLSIIRGVAEDMGTAPAYTASVPQGPYLSREDCEVMATLGAVEAMRFGSTTIADMYTNSDKNAEVFARVGLRAMVCEMVHDVDFLGLPRGEYRVDNDLGESLLRANIALIERWHGAENGRIMCCLGPHAPDTCTAPFLRRIAEVGSHMGVGLATHLAQSPREVRRIQAQYGLTSAQLLDSCGVLDAKFAVCAHGIFCTRQDAGLLAEKPNVSIAHAAEGNAKGGMVAPIAMLREKGVNVGIATDNGAANMIETMRIALCAGKIQTGTFDNPVAMQVLQMATVNGARALGLSHEIGSLEAGKKADIVIVDYQKPHMTPCIDAVGTLVHTGLGSDVDTVIIDGRITVRSGQVLTVPVDSLLRRAREVALRNWLARNPALDKTYMLMDE